MARRRSTGAIASVPIVLSALLAPRDGSAAAPPEKRSVPSYDGRPAETTAKDGALWLPRITLAPLYVVSEFVVRRPLGALVSWAETSGVPKAFYDFFAFGQNHDAGFAPIGFIDFGFNPSVGAYLFWNNAGVKGHDLAIHATTWGHEWLAGVFDERVRIGPKSALKFNFTAIHRPDLRFTGIGPDTRGSSVVRYGQDLLSMRTTFDLMPIRGRANRIETFFGFRATRFGEGNFGDDPGIVAASVRNGTALPDGFANGFGAVDSGARFAFDTRRSVTDSSLSGLRLDVEMTESSDLKRQPASSWVTYGGTFGAFWDLNDKGRVLNVSATMKFVDPLGSEPVPFTELIDGGGDGPLRGFISGRLRGRSVASASVRYRWPIWVDVDGAISASFGNVFDTHLRDFRTEKLRLSATLGIETVQSTGGSFQFLVGLGTETFEQGAAVDSVRVIIGSNRGF